MDKFCLCASEQGVLFFGSWLAIHCTSSVSLACLAQLPCTLKRKLLTERDIKALQRLVWKEESRQSPSLGRNVTLVLRGEELLWILVARHSSQIHCSCPAWFNLPMGILLWNRGLYRELMVKGNSK